MQEIVLSLYTIPLYMICFESYERENICFNTKTCINVRTIQIFYFYGLCRIWYRCIDYFLISFKDLYWF